MRPALCRHARVSYRNPMSLEILEQRERERKDRTLDKRVHNSMSSISTPFYDLEVDTSLFTPEQCAGQIHRTIAESPRVQKIKKARTIIPSDRPEGVA